MSQARNLTSVTKIFSGCLLGAAGLMSTLFFGLVTMIGVADLIKAAPTSFTSEVALVIFFGALTLMSILMLWGGYRLGQSGRALNEETRMQAATRRVLSLARAHSGRLTLSEVLLETHLDQQTAQTVLEAAYKNGIADLQISDSGQERYIFNFSDDRAPKSPTRSLPDPDQELEAAFEKLAQEFSEGEEHEVVLGDLAPRDEHPAEEKSPQPTEVAHQVRNSSD